MRKYFYILLAVSVSMFACKDKPRDSDNTETQVSTAPPFIPFSVVSTQLHDISSFTEGLEVYKGQLFESSGPGTDQSGEGAGPYPSGFGIVDSATGKVAPKVTLDKNKFFGEGITIFKGKIYQLTWQEKVGFVYDAKTFRKLREFSLPAAEGWGLTHDTASLFMSVGTNQLFVLHPDSLNTLNILTVHDNNGPVNARLNELEYINGYIYANEWLTNYISKIDPSSGKIVGKLDLTGIANEAKMRNANSNEMNGIAYDSLANQVLVTGKNWPLIYRIRM